MPKRPTLQDVADHSGLSLAAVSYALRGVRGSDETVRRVKESAEALGYRADLVARALASGRTDTVAVLCGSARDPWQQMVASDLSRALLARGRHAFLADADGDPEREVELLGKLRAQRPDGLLAIPLDPFAAHWHEAAEQLPVVAVGDRLSEAPRAGTVVFDNDAGMRLVFDHLAAMGHRRILVILTQRPSTPDRPAEQLVAVHAARVGIDARLMHTPPATADPDEMSARFSEILSCLEEPEDQRPTAAFCLADSLAHGVLRAAGALGVEVPGRLSVVGFENHVLSDLVGPGLTSVDWGEEEVVAFAVDQLLAAIDEDVELSTVTISPELVLRGSSGPAPTAPS